MQINERPSIIKKPVITKFFGLSKSMWGLICSYLSVKDEAQLQRCSKEALAFFRSLDKYGPLSEEKINDLYGKRHDKRNCRKPFFLNQPLEYKKSWFNRIFKLSTDFLEKSDEKLDENYFGYFTNLKIFVILSKDFEKFFISTSKFFHKKNNHINDKEECLLLDREIEVILAKNVLYNFTANKIERLFQIFPDCARLKFTPALNKTDLRDEMNCCFNAGLVPQKIKEIFSETVFLKSDHPRKNNFKTCGELTKKITAYKNDGRKEVKNCQNQKNYSNLFLYQYFDLGINLQEYDYLPSVLQMKKQPPLALYESFRISNFKYLNDHEKLILAPSFDFSKKQLPDTPLLNYDHLEKAAGGGCPLAEYLIFVIEKLRFGNDISEKRNLILESYLNSAAKKGYPPAVAIQQYFDEKKLLKERKVWEERKILEEQEKEVSTLYDVNKLLELFEEEESKNLHKRKFGEIEEN